MRLAPRTALLATVATAAGGLLLGGAPAAARPSAGGFCPGATTSADTDYNWAQLTLAPGVTLASTSITGSRGRVAIRVLSVDLTQPGVGIVPLNDDLASVHYLTSLADRPGIVAATNAQYFSLDYGPPVVPYIAGGVPMVLTSTPQRVVGLGTDELPEDGKAWLVGSVRSADSVMVLSAINDVTPPPGLSVITPAWGHHPFALPSDARTRPVRASHIAGPLGRLRTPPAGGSMLVARGDQAIRWLRSLANNAAIGVTASVATNAPVPFAQAYGTGTQVISQADQPRTNLICDRDVLAARTAIAWTRSRTTLLLLTAESPQGPDRFGLDWNQLSAVLTDLRAVNGYTLDGGTSTEMVARLPGHPNTLTLETAPHGNRQRAIPVGIGVRASG
ncbi:MAG TPA: phosphodiester glycosidase family protein [Mycobacteriales bacterium]|nr:phosphodiester glycosidase family protein [Mycobacteriales bacterium]